MSRKCRRWTEHEEQILFDEVEKAKQIGSKPNFTQISQLLHRYGYVRSRKACCSHASEARRGLVKRRGGGEGEGGQPGGQLPGQCLVPDAGDGEGGPEAGEEVAPAPAIGQPLRETHSAKVLALRSLRGRITAEKRAGVTPCPEGLHKILSFSDTHGHLARVGALNKMLLSNLDAEAAVIVGDLFDFHSSSYFVKQSNIPLIAEWDLVVELLLTVLEAFDKVTIVPGNHDDRPQRFIQKMLNAPDLYPIMEGALDPLRMLQMGYGFTPEGEFKQLYPEWQSRIQYSATGPMGGAAVTVGDVMFSHVDRFLKGPLKTVSAVSADASHRFDVPHRCCVQAHTHQWGYTIAGGVMLIEHGCMCDEPDYITHGNRRGRFPPQIVGWSEVWFDSCWRCDFARTRIMRPEMVGL